MFLGGSVRRKGAEVLVPIAGAWVVVLTLNALPVRLVGGQLQGAQHLRAAQQQQDTPETKVRQKEMFEGKITRSGGKLVLRDSADRSPYQLDDQQLAVFFEGQEVKVIGTLDASSYTIYISDMGISNPRGGPCSPPVERGSALQRKRSNAKHAITKTSPQRHSRTPVWYGVASWYERDNQGPRTANGERFEDQALTAAHPRLPMGTRVRVTNLRNGRSVLVKVNDRGPFTPGRLIDLSKGAAQQLGFIRQGLAPVRISVVSVPSPSATS
jgi:rare lipoprotein A